MRELLRYAMVGVVNTGLGYAVIFGCMYLAGLGPIASNMIGYAVGLVVSYTLNRSFTFRSQGARKAEMIRFGVIFVLAYVANLGVLVVLVQGAGMHEGLAQVVAGVVYFGLSYLLNRYYVFRRG